MATKLKCDIAIIGAGAAGLSVAAGAAQMGAKVILIENHRMGGDCLNYGCVPSKALLAAAKSVLQIRDAATLGIHAANITIDFTAVMAHIQQTIKNIEPNDSVERFEKLGVTVIRETGQFVDPNTLQAGDKLIQAKRFVIATGSSAFIPPIPGLANIPYLTNETIFNLTHLPEKLLIIGGGPIGCEMAQAFALLGADVTILEAGKLLAKDEPDMVAILRQQLLVNGIKIYEQANITQVRYNQNEFTVEFTRDNQQYKLTGTQLLVATGRQPKVKTLNLDAANIQFSNKGIQVNAHLRTTNHRVYAIGDVTGQMPFTHIASYHAGLILREILFKMPAKINYSATPWVTYTEPELAHVGMTLAQAQEKFGDTIQIFETDFKDNDRAQAEAKTLGKIKIITDKKAHVLGVTILGPQAGELLLPWIMIIHQKQTVRALTDVIVPYPTLSELSKRVAGEFYKPLIFSDKIKRLVRFMMRIT
jgi:pyruvate/2-oxoglutarate dehydrogenase complex dihydrolipoamide dehydrogenase (E3) component